MAKDVEKSGRTWLAAGTRLNDTYELEDGIAAGGMGEVYRGHNIETGDPVAIKMIRSDLAETEATMTMFRKEASALNKLYDPAIVRYYGFSVDPTLRRPYMAMEFVTGRSLGDTVKDAPMAFRDVCLMGARVARGLDVAHRRGIIHRDISPDNIIIPDEDVTEAKIIDFGIARQTKSEGTIVGDGLAGKYNYMSPEQLGLNGGDVRAGSDIYSLGLVLAEAVTGRAINMRGNPVELIEKRRKVPDLAHVDARLTPLITWMLQPEPQNRPGSMQEVAHWLTAVLAASAPGGGAGFDAGEGTVVLGARPAGVSPEAGWSMPPSSMPPQSMPPWATSPSMPPQSMPGPSMPPSSMMPQSMPPRSMPPQGAARPGGTGTQPGWPDGGAPRSMPPQPGWGEAGRSVPPPGWGEATPRSMAPQPHPSAQAPQAPFSAQAPQPVPAGWSDLARSPTAPPGPGPRGGDVSGRPEARPQSFVAAAPVDEATVIARPGPGGATAAPDLGARSLGAFGAPGGASEADRGAGPAARAGGGAATATTRDAKGPAGTTPAPGEAPKRSPLPLVAAVVGAVALVGGGGAAWLILGRSPTPGGGETARPVVSTPTTGGETGEGARGAGAAALEQWMATWNGGDCFVLAPVVVSDDRVVTDGFGRSIVPFESFDEAFRARNGFEADIRLRQVSEAQCPAVDLMARTRGDAAAAPRLELAQAHVRGGDFLSGMASAAAGRFVAVVEVRDDGTARVVAPSASGEQAAKPFVVPVEAGGGGRPRLMLALATTKALPALADDRPQPIAELVEKIERDAKRAGERPASAARYVVVER